MSDENIEIDRLRDLLRWRDAEDEKPESDSLVLVNLIEKFSGRIPVRVMRYSERPVPTRTVVADARCLQLHQMCEWIDPNAGIWMDSDVKYWRPIGPMPEGGG